MKTLCANRQKTKQTGWCFPLHNDNLPGYATFYLMTNFVQGEKYNLYKYRLEDEKFYLIAKNVSVGPGGLMAYYNDTCSDYILTKQVIEGAFDMIQYPNRESGFCWERVDIEYTHYNVGSRHRSDTGFCVWYRYSKEEGKKAGGNRKTKSLATGDNGRQTSSEKR